MVMASCVVTVLVVSCQHGGWTIVDVCCDCEGGLFKGRSVGVSDVRTERGAEDPNKMMLVIILGCCLGPIVIICPPGIAML